MEGLRAVYAWFAESPYERATLFFLVLNRIVKATPWHRDDDILDAVQDFVLAVLHPRKKG